MAEDLAGNLANYKLQLQQVNQSLLYIRRPLVKCGRADLRILERVRVKIMDLD